MATAPWLRAVLEPVRHSRVAKVVLDLGGVTFIDCSGFHPIHEVAQWLARQEVAVEITSVSSCVHRLLDLLGRTDLELQPVLPLPTAALGEHYAVTPASVTG